MNLDKIFKDKNGRVILGQKPNLPLVVWFASLILQKVSSDNLQSLYELISFGAIFTWAWLEIFQGVNYFRRILGLVVMFITLYSRIY